MSSPRLALNRVEASSEASAAGEVLLVVTDGATRVELVATSGDTAAATGAKRIAAAAIDLAAALAMASEPDGT